MKDFEFPFAKDKTTGKSSATLFFAYVGFLIAGMSVMYLLNVDAIAGTIASLVLFFGCLILYRLKQLDKVKIDLQNKSVELEDVQDTEEKKNEGI